MSGHSKWAQIKRKKGVNDTKKGQMFTRLGRDIMLAARQGGGDPDGNFSLRLAIDKARGSNMPKENIERAIKRGTGELGEGAQLEEITYEGYGPGGTAFLVEALTDNKNRTASDIRRVFTRGGGNMGSSNSVAWMFERKGIITLNTSGRNPEELELELIDAGAEDFKTDGDSVDVFAQPENLHTLKKDLDKQKITIESAEITWVAKTPASVSIDDAVQTMKLIESFEEMDDVQKVTSNLDITDDIMAQFEKVAA
jgi:YebC/PmpR family DNA-binding regulatory protein